MGPPAAIDYDIVQTFDKDKKNIDAKFREGVNPINGVDFPIFVRLLNDQEPPEKCVFQSDSRPHVSIIDAHGEVIKSVSFNVDGTAKFDAGTIKLKSWKVRATHLNPY